MSEKDENERIIYNNIIYSINEWGKSAYAIRCRENLDKIVIQRSINHKSKEYNVTNILKNAFKNSQIKLVQFELDSKLQSIDDYAFSESLIESITIPSSVKLIGKGAFYNCNQLQNIEILNDSMLQTIDRSAFSFSKIESITIPSKLIELKEGWCFYITNLTKINVSPQNPRYYCYENKMIIGKTKINQNNYDCIVFCIRNIQNINIPNFIEHICSSSFDNCKHLKKVEIQNDSKLQTIEKYAFYKSTIGCIYIPSSVTLIGKGAFFACKQLQKIEIANDSKLQIIDEDVFAESAIKCFKIPPSVTLIRKGSFYSCEKLRRVEITSDSNLQTIEKEAFYNSKINSIIIPFSVTLIEENAFIYCQNLLIIEIFNPKMMSMYQTSFKNCTNALLMIHFHY